MINRAPLGPTIKVFRVKRALDPCWGNAALYQLLTIARASYLRYGQINPLDEYDNKAVIYAARVSYSYKGAQLCEWLSLRFVPHSGTPIGFEDTSFYLRGNKPVIHEIRRRILNPNGLSLRDCVSGSRICGVGPYLPKPGYAQELPRHNQFAGLCFAAMHRPFFQDYPEYKLLISQIPDNFLERVLTTPPMPKPHLTTASRALGYADQAVRLDRNNRYIYKFPLYFLNPGDVLTMFQRLYYDGQINEATLIHYFGNRLTSAMIKSGNWPSMEKLSNLGLMFNADGRICGSKLTGEDLRGILASVQDGPKLRVVRMPYLKRVINQMIGD